ncbi:hypothetical protein ACS0TY_032569 [Phlomoides rotata]
MLVVKVINSNTVLQKGAAASPHLRNTRIAEYLVGDDTTSILFTARNDQVDLMKPEGSVILRNAKIDMRLAVDKWGCIKYMGGSFVLKTGQGKQASCTKQSFGLLTSMVSGFLSTWWINATPILLNMFLCDSSCT